MTDRSAPWWFSGDSSAGEPSSNEVPKPSGSSDSGLSLGSLMAGAQQLFDTVVNTIMAHKQEASDVGYSYL
jgi:hypothetical protein